MAYLSRIYLFMNYQLHIRSHHLLALFGFLADTLVVKAPHQK